MLSPPSREVWYITFDGAAKAAGDLRDNQDNIPRLKTLLESVPGGGTMTIKFKALMQDAADSINSTATGLLAKKRRPWPYAPVEVWDASEPAVKPFAIFSAGSFTWWQDLNTEPDWKRAIEQYQKFIKNTSIPFFGVCGSHQLVAMAYGAKVVHMINQQDATTVHPKWDPGEKGVFPVRLVPNAPSNDELVRFWQGSAPTRKSDGPKLTKAADGNSAVMSLHHVNEVLSVPEGFQHLFTSEGASGTYHREPTLSTDNGSNQTGTVTGATMSTKTSSKPIDVWWTAEVDGQSYEAKRCTVQGMKLNDPDRLLYTTQFHCEVDGWGGGDDLGNGEALLTKFFEMAADWWSSHSTFTTP